MNSKSRARTRRIRRADRDDPLYVTSAGSGLFPVRTQCVQRPERHQTPPMSRTHIHRAVCVIYLSCVTPTLVGTLSLYEKKSIYINTLDNILYIKRIQQIILNNNINNYNNNYNNYNDKIIIIVIIINNSNTAWFSLRARD